MTYKWIPTTLGAVALAASAGAIAASVSSANAADIYDYDASMKDTAVYAPAPIWTGFYVGAHVGYTWAEWDGPFSYDDAPKYEQQPGYIFDDSDKSIDGDDWLAGVQVGANIQYGLWVVGLETDVSWTGAEGNFTHETYPDDAPDTLWDVTTEVELFGTARMRLGYLVRENLLLYATGGLAWAETESDIQVREDKDADPNAWGNADATHLGYTLGGGLEWMVAPNWTLKGEYLYYDLGEEDYAFTGTQTTGDGYYHTDRLHPELDGHIVRVGVNYLLNRRDAPVESLK